jgi:hypothetical protein
MVEEKGETKHVGTTKEGGSEGSKEGGSGGTKSKSGTGQAVKDS